MKRIFFYFTHKESLGHSIRTISIAKILSKSARVYVFNGGKKQQYLNIPKELKWFDLPHPYYNKFNFKSSTYKPRLYKQHIKQRIYFVKRLAEKIKPDIFITEFFPFARAECQFELIPLIKFLKSNGVKIFSSAGYPFISTENTKILLKCFKLYDKILVHTPKKFGSEYRSEIKNLSLKRIYDLSFEIYNSKISYTGFILPYNSKITKSKSELKKSIGATGKKLILVSRGGGVIGPKMISSTILSKQYLPDNYIFLIVAGPASSKKELEVFKKIAKKVSSQIKIETYLENFFNYLNACDLSISQVGYNTSVQLMYLNKKSILIPQVIRKTKRILEQSPEQLNRARALNKYLGAKILDYNQLSPKLIANVIIKSIQSEQQYFIPRTLFANETDIIKQFLL